MDLLKPPVWKTQGIDPETRAGSWGRRADTVPTLAPTPDPSFDPLQKRKEARKQHPLGECKEFLRDGRAAQELLRRNPEKYAEYRESCVAHGLLAPKVTLSKQPERRYTDEELALRSDYDPARLKHWFQEGNGIKDNPGTLAKENPVEYQRRVKAAVIFGILGPEANRQAQQPAKRNEDLAFVLNDDLCAKFKLPAGTKVTMTEFESMVRLNTEKQAAQNAAATNEGTQQ